MDREVNLLSYWMPILRQIKEFREIAEAEEPEVKALLEACDRTLSNFFITTADEYGISQFEKLLKIFPEEGKDLEARRSTVLVKWNNVVPYTDEELCNKLTSFCGEGKFIITPHYEDYAIEISTEIGVKGAFDTITLDLLDTLPCNLVVTIQNFIKAQTATPFSVGVAVPTAMSYRITNDIDSEVSTVSTINTAVANSTAVVIALRDEGTSIALLGRATLGMMVLNAYSM